MRGIVLMLDSGGVFWCNVKEFEGMKSVKIWEVDSALILTTDINSKAIDCVLEAYLEGGTRYHVEKILTNEQFGYAFKKWLLDNGFSYVRTDIGYQQKYSVYYWDVGTENNYSSEGKDLVEAFLNFYDTV
jgi:hypothetical protein